MFSINCRPIAKQENTRQNKIDENSITKSIQFSDAFWNAAYDQNNVVNGKSESEIIALNSTINGTLNDIFQKMAAGQPVL